jgi:hypothetical protein
MAHGSIPAGPSSLYLSLLKGKITAEDYAKQAKKRVQEDSRKHPAATAGDPARAGT